MIWFLLGFYWFFSSMFVFGIDTINDVTASDYAKDFARSLICGFILFPIVLGRKFTNLIEF